MADYKRMTKTVLILTNSISGLHNFRREVVKAICDDGYKVIISVPEDDFKAAFFRDLGCDIVLTKLNRRGMNPIADISQFWEYRRLMNQHRPIAVLTYTIKPNIYGGLAARFCRIPQLANITGLGDALENGGWLQRLTISSGFPRLANSRLSLALCPESIPAERPAIREELPKPATPICAVF